MRAKDTARCSPCRGLPGRVDALEAELAALKQVVARLSPQLGAARKDSSTSSQPPWGDLVKPPQPPSPQGQDRRHAGGEAGHPKPQRAAFPPASVHGGCFAHRLDSGPWGGQDRRPPLTLAPRGVQPVDLGEGLLSIQGPRRPPGGGPPGPKRDEAPLPPGIERGGLVGPSLTPGSASLKGSCPASFWTVRTFLRDVVGVTIWRGERARLIGKLSRAWERPDEELREDLPPQAGLNVDQTGPPQNGPRPGSWCFGAERDTLFQIDPSRRAAVLIEVGDAAFEGVPGWDSFSASCRYPREFGGVLQFGLASLSREGKFQRTGPEAWDRASGERLREALRRLLGVIQRPEGWSAATWRSRGGAAWVAVWRCGLQEAPETRPRRPLAKRGETPGASCFRFLRTPGVEPTHTLAEPAIRLVGRDGVVRPGTRSEVGKRWGERLWTAIARCTQQGQSVFASVPSAVEGWFAGTEAPALFPEG